MMYPNHLVGLAIGAGSALVGSPISLEGVNRPVKTKLKQTSNSTHDIAALSPLHCCSAALPDQNSGTVAPAENFVTRFKNYE